MRPRDRHSAGGRGPPTNGSSEKERGGNPHDTLWCCASRAKEKRRAQRQSRSNKGMAGGCFRQFDPAETGASTRTFTTVRQRVSRARNCLQLETSPLARRGSASPWPHRLRNSRRARRADLPMRHSKLRDHRAGCGRAPTVSGRDSGLMPKWSASCAPMNPAVKLCGSSGIIVASHSFHCATSRS
jgi:hypothetical protein